LSEEDVHGRDGVGLEQPGPHLSNVQCDR